MDEDLSDKKTARLLQLSDEVSRIAGSLAQLSIGLGAAIRRHYPCSNLNDLDVPLEHVTWAIQVRRKRARYLPRELFGEPAWDILLELLRAELVEERISVASACTAADVPASTGLRWIKTLEQQGLVLRECDCRDAARTFLVLAPDTSKALRRYFGEVAAPGFSHAM
jgi:hypothetical protein